MSLTLWLTDRSRYETGVGHCPRARYLGYHAGPHGYGWARKAQSVPTVTGTLIHQPLADILGILQREDRLPTDRDVHEAIEAACADYRALVEKRGLTAVLEPEGLALRVNEQLTLLAGLVWTWVRVVLPQFHEDWRVVEVEREDVTVLGCTCGLGDQMGTAEEHDARGCGGLGWMTRGDCLAKRRTLPSYAYHDFKSTSQASGNWEAGFLHRVQLIAGVLGAERRLGVTIDQVYLHALIKGKYESSWDPEQRKAVGPKYQNTPLVYGWKREANPPLMEEDWAVSYQYVDTAGKHRRRSGYERAGVWTLPESVWGGCLSPTDYWTRALAAEGKLSESYRLIGPIAREDWKLDGFLRQLQGEEGRWQNALWALHVLRERGVDWGHPEFMAKLDEVVPQNRGDACHSYFGETCPNLPLCDRLSGWEAPETCGFVARRPHHIPEYNQAVSRGLLPPEDADSTEE